MAGAILAGIGASCGADLASPPAASPPSLSTPTRTTPRPLPTNPLSPSVARLLATLPTEAGGVEFDSIRVIDDTWHVGSYVDDVLASLDKSRKDAVSVFRHADGGVSIGATQVEGVVGATLLQAFVDKWHAPRVVARFPRPPVEFMAWELRSRLGELTVVYLRNEVVYLVEATDRAVLEAILLDTCCKVE